MLNHKVLKKIALLLILSVSIASCSSEKVESVYENVEELNGRDMGCMSGSIFDETIREVFPASKITYFSSRSELLLGLGSGKIEAFVSDEPVAMMMCKQNEGVTYLPEAIGEVEYGICFSENASSKLTEFDQFLAKISSNGHLEELQKKWIAPEGTSQKKEEIELSKENGTLRCVTTPDAAPFSFMSGNVFQGYEVEILNEFCYEYGYDLQIDTVSFDALLTSVAMNKYDVAFNGIYITPERAKSVNFCTPVYKGNVVVMIRSGSVENDKNLIGSIREASIRILSKKTGICFC